MTQTMEDSLLKAIKTDDIKAFDALMEKNQCGAYRLGRFPTLSLMYLYRSRKLLSAYEDIFLNITSFKIISEPMEISSKFSSKAGKCLRLYFNEVVSPLEMLLILDMTGKLRQVYPKVKAISSAVKGRLKSIYHIKYSLNVRFEGDGIVIDRRPLSYGEKKKIATVCLCLILALIIVVGGPITINALIPKPIEGEVTNLKNIDFGSEKTYTLKQDLVIPENYSIEKVNCTIIGDGKKLIFGKGANMGELNGKLSNLTIESFGDAIFNVVSYKGSIENVTLNVNANVKSTDGTAFVALTNYGSIENVTLNVSGKIVALATSTEATTELIFSGIVNQNYVLSSNIAGTVKNCVVNYSQFSIEGEASANAVFGGVAGVNNGYLQDSKVTGEIIADTFDIAGICVVNNGVLSDDTNQANLTQTSDDTGWNPLVCGIVMRNSYAVTACKNIGNLSSTSYCSQSDVQEGEEPTVSVAGIAYTNSGGIEKCQSGGDITAIGIGEAYVGGIASHSFSNIYNCLSSGAINVTAKEIYAGGILGASEITSYGNLVYFSNIDYCISESKINVNLINATSAYVGGIVGYVREEGFNADNSTIYYGGCVTNSYFMGESGFKDSYFGNIVGVCGANIYEKNLFNSSSGTDYYNFYGNYYVDNSSNAFGATVTDENDFIVVEENKGATSATLEYMRNSQGYNKILKNLGLQ